MSITIKLDRLLLERKMRMGELARLIDITEANLSILKNGKARAIRFSTLDAICRALDCQPGDILGFTDELSESA
jgi:putative transcriptional regulator